LIQLIKLPRHHPAVEYILGREIPRNQLERIFYTDQFYQYVNDNIPNKFSQWLINNHEHPRIILPMIDQDQSWIGVIGRSLIQDDKTRYLTIKFQPDAAKIFGLNLIDYSKEIFVVEGAIDSLFLDNCVAMAGTDTDLRSMFRDDQSLTIILDNEPRNKEVVSKYSKYISEGYSIVIWPSWIEGKDINKMLNLGLTQTQIKQTIADNTFSGLTALAKFSKWKLI
jgi:hypothetical protein